MRDIATYMQVDMQNLFYAARNKGQRIDFEKVWNFFNQRGTEFLTDAVVYMIRRPDFDGSKFEAKMESIGYPLSIKNIQKNGHNHKQANHDVSIAVDCMDRINTFNKWILMSGDGDFVDLCKFSYKNITRHRV